MSNGDCLILEVRDYPIRLVEKVLGILALLLFGFGLLMVFVESRHRISAFTVLSGLLIITLLYFNKYFFQSPSIKGVITLNQDSVVLLGKELVVSDLDYLAIRLIDYRGQIPIKRHEYPFPKFGTKNEIKIRTKSGQSFESKFFVAKKSDRKKVDPFVNHWIDKVLKVDYLINDEMIITSVE